MKVLKFIFNIAILSLLFWGSSCKRNHAIACPSYWNGDGGDTRGTPLTKDGEGKVAPEGASVRKSGNGIVKKKKNKNMNANSYRGKGKANK